MASFLIMPSGSSPHTRGTLGGKLDALRHVRFIPAYAGNACGGARTPSALAVHPRIRGERLAKSPRNSHTAGSSPHTRGTQDNLHRVYFNDRFIPAYAGNAPNSGSCFLRGAVHPRIRGERFNGAGQFHFSAGSSPHTRGTRRELPTGHLVQRFIPAYAGNAILTDERSILCAVHPRIRGERFHWMASRIATCGSSPHTRGTHQHRHPPRRLGLVHPRIRGERGSILIHVHPSCGSSPHTRGTLVELDQSGSEGRFIPAYAGNARSASRPEPSSTVHPRIRGERDGNSPQRVQKNGSSPHTRGTHAPLAARCPVSRFIPAYAGNAVSSDNPWSAKSVHPRIRGERAVIIVSTKSPFGSSPHTRGTPCTE